MATSDAPVSVGKVTLTVRDLDKTAEFYQNIIGLGLLERDGETARLGTDAGTLIELHLDRKAVPSPKEAGLFHTAFLLPTRQDLGAWLNHAAEQGALLDGASHHGVSEALYLNDPEGNGVEIYSDLPRETWTRLGDTVHMTTRRLDLSSLRKAAGHWRGAPDGSVIGHVHLRVGDVDEAARFVTHELSMVETFRLPSARWFGSGGYHHHLAANTWHSNGAGQRTHGTAGLASVELLATPGTLAPGRKVDPWGTEITITAAQARAA